MAKMIHHTRFIVPLLLCKGERWTPSACTVYEPVCNEPVQVYNIHIHQCKTVCEMDDVLVTPIVAHTRRSEMVNFTWSSVVYMEISHMIFCVLVPYVCLLFRRRLVQISCLLIANIAHGFTLHHLAVSS
jgi:hypothetical protein